MTDPSRFTSSEGTMPMRLLPILLLFALVFSGSVSWAAAPGPYLEVEGYGTWLADSKNDTDTGSFNIEYDGAETGWGVALGYDLVDAYPQIGQGRLELEAASRKNSLKKLDFAEGDLPATGDVTVKSLMVNTIAEYHNGTIWVPYLAIGLGYAEVSIDRIRTTGTDFISSSSDGVFAYQVGAGLGIAAGDHVTFDVGYRYFATLDPELELADGSKFTTQIGSHNVLLGMRFKY